MLMLHAGWYGNYLSRTWDTVATLQYPLSSSLSVDASIIEDLQRVEHIILNRAAAWGGPPKGVRKSLRNFTALKKITLAFSAEKIETYQAFDSREKARKQIVIEEHPITGEEKEGTRSSNIEKYIDCLRACDADEDEFVPQFTRGIIHSLNDKPMRDYQKDSGLPTNGELYVRLQTLYK